MDAVEYVKTLRRLCKSKERCPGCKLYNKEDGYCIVDTNEYAEEAVQIVEQWAKDHPVKTRQSEFLKMFPDAVIDEDDGILCIDPCTIDGSIGCTNGKGCDGCRRKYWLAEVTDND
mgnify:CR=1 FL=1|nr:MAG TPA: hypothetical protein [Caudoviricetes sp.]